MIVNTISEIEWRKQNMTSINHNKRSFTMNSLQGRKFFSVVVTLLAFAILTVGCSNDSASNLTGPQNESLNSNALFKPTGKGKGKGNDQNNGVNNTGSQYNWPVIESYTYEFNAGQGYYNGGKITFGSQNRSKFEIEPGALTPPSYIPWGDPVTVTMEINYDSTAKRLDFTFGPHGAQFSPQATVKIDYRALDVDIPKLYYIDDNGNYILQQPDQIDANKRWLILKLDHFSRYALLHS